MLLGQGGCPRKSSRSLEQAWTEQQILKAAGKALSRSTLKRALTDLMREGCVFGKKGAGAASAKAIGYWLSDGPGEQMGLGRNE